MNLTRSLPSSGTNEVLPAFLSAFVVVMILFFIDEGYYDFRWMTDPGNWFVFCIYLLIFFPIQWLLSSLLFRNLSGWKKIVAMVIFTVPVTLGILWLLS